MNGACNSQLGKSTGVLSFETVAFFVAEFVRIPNSDESGYGQNTVSQNVTTRFQPSFLHSVPEPSLFQAGLPADADSLAVWRLENLGFSNDNMTS